MAGIVRAVVGRRWRGGRLRGSRRFWRWWLCGGRRFKRAHIARISLLILLKAYVALASLIDLRAVGRTDLLDSQPPITIGPPTVTVRLTGGREIGAVSKSKILAVLARDRVTPSRPCARSLLKWRSSLHHRVIPSPRCFALAQIARRSRLGRAGRVTRMPCGVFSWAGCIGQPPKAR